MASEAEVRKHRARVAREIHTLMLLDPDFEAAMEDYGAYDDEGELVFLTVAEEESAVLVLHRIEALHLPKVIIVLNKGEDSVQTICITSTPSDGAEEEEDIIEVVGGITARQWIDEMVEHRGMAYRSSGAEFSVDLADISRQFTPA